MTLVLTGTEIILRPLTLADAEALAQAAGESREQYRFNPVPSGLEESRSYIELALRQQAAGERMPFAIVWRGKVVGTTSYWELQPWQWPAVHKRLQRSLHPDVAEVGGTWLAASAQRTRCNTEAKYLLLAHAFEEWAVYRVSFRTDERNERSRHAIERLGARFEGVRRADRPGVDGTVRNSAFYSIVREEWPQVKQRLTALLRRVA